MASMIPYDRYNRLARSVFPFDDVFDSFLAPVSTPADFKMDVEDAGDKYVISAHVTSNHIYDKLNEARLSITVDKKDSDEQKAKNYLQRETGEYTCTRGVFLKDAGTAGLSAKLADGILTVNVPKQDEKANVTKVSID